MNSRDAIEISQRLCITMLVLVFLILIPFQSVVTATNFVCSDPEMGMAAEQARTRSAMFWTGRTLPGPWFRPCPISFKVRSQPGGGHTQFRFENGEVSGWMMNVIGDRSELLQDVIPHEVDHMVRASLTRKPIERWIDEGCASLLESPASHERLRTIAGSIPASIFSDEWLERAEYPQSAEEIQHLYAGGFSLVEYLLSCRPPQVMIAFQKDAGTVAERLQRHYQLTPQGLRSGWSQRQITLRSSRCRDVCCPVHQAGSEPVPRPSTGQQSEVSGRPRLDVWSASWCGACRRFRSDLKQSPAFRQQLELHFELHWHDADQEQGLARQLQIQALPTFLTPDRRLTGYQGTDKLLRELGVAHSIAEPISNRAIPESVPLPREQSPEVEPAGQLAVTHPSVSPPSQPAVISFSDSAGVPPMAEPPGESATALPSWIGEVLPCSLTMLEWAGVIGGATATGGIGGVLITLLKGRLQRRLRTSLQTHSASERSSVGQPVPFPRELDEARELLELRQSEGRVAVLDALRGLFLDDELQKVESSSNPHEVQVARRLREAIDTRVAEIAPLSCPSVGQ
ncbi:thioredoxin family protein [Planctomicrobium sp. SH527]|uniref:thioredoxin family protein n=1 Tax=Planctomicrobium sp. SH527 TaxID=3448123 RepID=UPI003F5CB6BA